jgi:Pyruvate/2-oxoacid:ferredoxin oxidoreductase gamma subunit
LQIRIHGRGGQGVVTATELLSIAAFEQGRHAQAFPSFGSERTGAPVVAFCRIDDSEIRLREPILAPDVLIVQDPTLLHQVDVFQGLQPDGYVLINSKRSFAELGLADIATSASARAADHRAGHRDRHAAPRPAAAQRRAARRLCGAVGADHAGRGGARDPRQVQRQGRRQATSAAAARPSPRATAAVDGGARPC